VHNLREMRMAMGKGEDFYFPYAKSFDDALKFAVEKEVSLCSSPEGLMCC